MWKFSVGFLKWLEIGIWKGFRSMEPHLSAELATNGEDEEYGLLLFWFCSSDIQEKTR